MSCYIVNDKHLSAIIRWACVNNIKAGRIGNPGRYAYQPGQEQEAVNLLHAANVRSVNARYNESTPLDGAVYDPPAPLLTPIEVIKACDGLAYQCDEWEFFEGSEAQTMIRDIQRHAIRQLPGHEAAKWSIE